LIDPASAGLKGQPGYQLSQMMEAVRRDLEELLNTRQTLGELGHQRERVRQSILGYGLPEITSLPAITPQQRNEIARLLQATVTRYEPRLRDVRVILLESEAVKPVLRFRIEARLVVEPSPEVAYDTVVEVSTGQHTVRHSELAE
jgi:type VI secretion system protein ImpF